MASAATMMTAVHGAPVRTSSPQLVTSTSPTHLQHHRNPSTGVMSAAFASHSPSPLSRPSTVVSHRPAMQHQPTDVSVLVSQAAANAAAAAAAASSSSPRTSGLHSRPSSVSLARSVPIHDAEKGLGGGAYNSPASPRPSYDVYSARPSYDFSGAASARSSHDFGAFPPSWHGYGDSTPRGRTPVGDMLLRAAHDRLSCGNRSGALGRGLIVGWVITTLGFLAATAFYKGELFAALDRLSKDLYDMGYQGLLVFGVLIFITTIPPLPLYSTLIVLSGYTFGVWDGFVASYIASLLGAVVVFIVSRTMLRDAVTRSLASSPTATSLLQIIPQHPHLLLLIRVAPYPYNLLNVVLASSPALSLQTYTACTALSLCKLVLHTWIGAGIHDLSAAYTGEGGSTGAESIENAESDAHHERVKAGVTWGGIILCCVLFVYLTHIAKRAIARAQEEQAHQRVPEEEVAFLSRESDSD